MLGLMQEASISVWNFIGNADLVKEITGEWAIVKTIALPEETWEYVVLPH